MRWIRHTYRFQTWAVLGSAAGCAWLAHKLPFPFWVKFVALMAVGFPVDFLVRHRPVGRQPGTSHGKDQRESGDGESGTKSGDRTGELHP